MTHLLRRTQSRNSLRVINPIILFSFLINSVIPPSLSFAQNVPGLPKPGVIVSTTPVFTPAMLKGITIHPENPFYFNFIVDTGDQTILQSNKAQAKTESETLIKYFLAGLTIPEKDLWVNLSPYEKERISSDELGITQMGRDLLGQDYVLKQLMASLTYPETGLGKRFWDMVYQKAYELYGTTNIPMNTFNKVWIVPDKAFLYESEEQNTVYIMNSHLKVMMEEDYLAINKNAKAAEFGTDQLQKEDVEHISNVSSNVAKEVLIPAIEKEVNEGKNFAQLRQVYNALILAAWYKKRLKESFLYKVYVDQKKIDGVDVNDKKIREKIYEQYLEAFKAGVYSYIKEDIDPYSKNNVPRKYFSGGADFVDIGEEVNPEIADTREEKLALAREIGRAEVLNVEALTDPQQKGGGSLGIGMGVLGVTPAAGEAGQSTAADDIEFITPRGDVALLTFDGTLAETVSALLDFQHISRKEILNNLQAKTKAEEPVLRRQLANAFGATQVVLPGGPRDLSISESLTLQKILELNETAGLLTKRVDIDEDFLDNIIDAVDRGWPEQTIDQLFIRGLQWKEVDTALKAVAQDKRKEKLFDILYQQIIAQLRSVPADLFDETQGELTLRDHIFAQPAIYNIFGLADLNYAERYLLRMASVRAWFESSLSVLDAGVKTGTITPEQVSETVLSFLWEMELARSHGQIDKRLRWFTAKYQDQLATFINALPERYGRKFAEDFIQFVRSRSSMNVNGGPADMPRIDIKIGAYRVNNKTLINANWGGYSIDIENNLFRFYVSLLVNLDKYQRDEVVKALSDALLKQNGLDIRLMTFIEQVFKILTTRYLSHPVTIELLRELIDKGLPNRLFQRPVTNVPTKTAQENQRKNQEARASYLAWLEKFGMGQQSLRGLLAKAESGATALPEGTPEVAPPVIFLPKPSAVSAVFTPEEENLYRSLVAGRFLLSQNDLVNGQTQVLSAIKEARQLLKEYAKELATPYWQAKQRDLDEQIRIQQAQTTKKLTQKKLTIKDLMAENTAVARVWTYLQVARLLNRLLLINEELKKQTAVLEAKRATLTQQFEATVESRIQETLASLQQEFDKWVDENEGRIRTQEQTRATLEQQLAQATDPLNQAQLRNRLRTREQTNQQFREDFERQRIQRQHALEQRRREELQRLEAAREEEVTAALAGEQESVARLQKGKNEVERHLFYAQRELNRLRWAPGLQFPALAFAERNAQAGILEQLTDAVDLATVGDAMRDLRGLLDSTNVVEDVLQTLAVAMGITPDILENQYEEGKGLQNPLEAQMKSWARVLHLNPELFWQRIQEIIGTQPIVVEEEQPTTPTPPGPSLGTEKISAALQTASLSAEQQSQLAALIDRIEQATNMQVLGKAMQDLKGFLNTNRELGLGPKRNADVAAAVSMSTQLLNFWENGRNMEKFDDQKIEKVKKWAAFLELNPEWFWGRVQAIISGIPTDDIGTKFSNAELWRNFSTGQQDKIRDLVKQLESATDITVLGQVMRELKDFLGVGSGEIAETMGIVRRSFTDYERGENLKTFDEEKVIRMEIWAQKLGLNPDWFLGRIDAIVGSQTVAMLARINTLRENLSSRMPEVNMNQFSYDQLLSLQQVIQSIGSNDMEEGIGFAVVLLSNILSRANILSIQDMMSALGLSEGDFIIIQIAPQLRTLSEQQIKDFAADLGLDADWFWQRVQEVRTLEGQAPSPTPPATAPADKRARERAIYDQMPEITVFSQEITTLDQLRAYMKDRRGEFRSQGMSNTALGEITGMDRTTTIAYENNTYPVVYSNETKMKAWAKSLKVNEDLFWSKLQELTRSEIDTEAVARAVIALGDEFVAQNGGMSAVIANTIRSLAPGLRGDDTMIDSLVPLVVTKIQELKTTTPALDLGPEDFMPLIDNIIEMKQQAEDVDLIKGAILETLQADYADKIQGYDIHQIVEMIYKESVIVNPSNEDIRSIAATLSDLVTEVEELKEADFVAALENIGTELLKQGRFLSEKPILDKIMDLIPGIVQARKAPLSEKPKLEEEQINLVVENILDSLSEEEFADINSIRGLIKEYLEERHPELGPAEIPETQEIIMEALQRDTRFKFKILVEMFASSTEANRDSDLEMIRETLQEESINKDEIDQRLREIESAGLRLRGKLQQPEYQTVRKMGYREYLKQQHDKDNELLDQFKDEINAILELGQKKAATKIVIGGARRDFRRDLRAWMANPRGLFRKFLASKDLNAIRNAAGINGEGLFEGDERQLPIAIVYYLKINGSLGAIFTQMFRGYDAFVKKGGGDQVTAKGEDVMQTILRGRFTQALADFGLTPEDIAGKSLAVIRNLLESQKSAMQRNRASTHDIATNFSLILNNERTAPFRNELGVRGDKAMLKSTDEFFNDLQAKLTEARTLLNQTAQDQWLQGISKLLEEVLPAARNILNEQIKSKRIELQPQYPGKGVPLEKLIDGNPIAQTALLYLRIARLVNLNKKISHSLEGVETAISVKQEGINSSFASQEQEIERELVDLRQDFADFETKSAQQIVKLEQRRDALAADIAQRLATEKENISAETRFRQSRMDVQNETLENTKADIAKNKSTKNEAIQSAVTRLQELRTTRDQEIQAAITVDQTQQLARLRLSKKSVEEKLSATEAALRQLQGQEKPTTELPNTVIKLSEQTEAKNFTSLQDVGVWMGKRREALRGSKSQKQSKEELAADMGLTGTFPIKQIEKYERGERFPSGDNRRRKWAEALFVDADDFIVLIAQLSAKPSTAAPQAPQPATKDVSEMSADELRDWLKTNDQTLQDLKGLFKDKISVDTLQDLLQQLVKDIKEQAFNQDRDQNIKIISAIFLLTEQDRWNPGKLRPLLYRIIYLADDLVEDLLEGAKILGGRFSREVEEGRTAVDRIGEDKIDLTGKAEWNKIRNLILRGILPEMGYEEQKTDVFLKQTVTAAQQQEGVSFVQNVREKLGISREQLASALNQKLGRVILVATIEELERSEFTANDEFGKKEFYVALGEILGFDGEQFFAQFLVLPTMGLPTRDFVSVETIPETIPSPTEGITWQQARSQLGERLRANIQAQGITPVQIATELRKSLYFVNALIVGKYFVESEQQFLKLSAFLKLAPETLLPDYRKHIQAFLDFKRISTRFQRRTSPRGQVRADRISGGVPEFANRLRDLIDKKYANLPDMNAKVAKFAEELRLNSDYVDIWTKEDRIVLDYDLPKIDQLERMANHLGVNITELYPQRVAAIVKYFQTHRWELPLAPARRVELNAWAQSYTPNAAAGDKALLKKVGGIDLNTANLDTQIQKQGKGVQILPQVPFDIKNFENTPINGFIPVIIDITPAANLPFQLGIDSPQASPKQVSLLTN